MTKHLPFVALKVATSLDGQMAHISGESKWITGEEARLYSHFLRAQYDAILIGKQTFLRDRPNLDIRHPLFEGKKNKVIVLDTHGESIAKIEKSNLCKNRDPQDVYVAVSEAAKKISRLITLVHCKQSADGGIDIWIGRCNFIKKM